MTIEDLPTQDHCVEKQEHTIAQEALAAIKFKPQALVWENFHAKQPEFDRWVYLWCAFGKLGQNIYVTYRNALGQYELPHPTKQFPAHAWAYADNPIPEEQANVGTPEAHK